MSKIPTVFVIAPDGSKINRQTARIYSHAVVFKSERLGAWVARSWCGRPDLAQRALADALSCGCAEAQLVEVQS